MPDINAAAAYIALKNKYIHFLLDKMTGTFSEFGNDTKWQAIRKQLTETWNEEDMSKGIFPAPLLESLFNYPACGVNTEQLIAPANATDPTDEKPAHHKMKGILPESYQLYTHQLEALKAYADGKNMIISSGTGSGKTECFLYPMINRILWEETAAEASIPGVKVLLVYPMNALVNDQRNRIVKMLAFGNTGLKVGVYTSQTKNHLPGDAQATWQKEISKALQENLHLSENVANRKVKDVWVGDRESIRKNPPDILITNYSMLEYMLLRKKDEEIFNQHSLQTVILDEAHFYSGTLGDDLHMLLRRTLLRMGFDLADNQVRFIATSATIGNDEELENAAKALFFGKNDNNNYNIEVITGEREPIAYNGDETRFSDTLRNLRSDLVGNNNGIPISLSNEQITALAELDDEGRKFIPAKLHTFFKLPEMYYSDLNVSDNAPLGELSISPLRNNNITAIPCYYCSGSKKGIYFHAMANVGFERITLSSPLLNDPDDTRLVKVFFRPSIPQDPVNLRFKTTLQEDGSWLGEMDDNGPFTFAVAIDDPRLFVLGNEYINADTKWKSLDGKTLAVREIWDANEEDLPENNDKRYLFPLGHISKNMMTTVMTENLMEYLPDCEGNINELPWNGRQALLFADSRGNAAWNAVSIQNWRQRDYIRNCIFGELVENEGTSVNDICNVLSNNIYNQVTVPQKLRKKIEDKDMTDEIQRTFIPALVIGELAIPLAGNGRTLEAMQLISPVYNDLPTCPADIANDKWHSHILPEIFDALRRRGYIYHERIQWIIENCRVDRQNQDRDYLGDMIPFRLAQAGVGRTYKSIREDYDDNQAAGVRQYQYACRKSDFTGSTNIQKIINKYYPESEQDNLRRVSIAERIFDTLCAAAGNTAYLKLDITGGRRTPVRLLSINIAELKFKRNSGKIYANKETFALRRFPDETNVPPEWYDVTQALENSDDWNIIANDAGIGNIVPAEHSAQLENDELEFIEAKFKENKINLISCTPTMEIGIDIGSLHAVMQANLPPERANYVQRVGRAGRRGNNSALALTILTDSMFDTYIAADTREIYRRPLTFAKTDLTRDENEIKRHINMFFISEFFRTINFPELYNAGNNPIGSWESTGLFFATEENIRAYRDFINDKIADFPDDDIRNKFAENVNKINSLLRDFADRGIEMPIYKNISSAAIDQAKYEALISSTACEMDYSFETARQEIETILNEISERCNSNWQRLLEDLNNQALPDHDARRLFKSRIMQLEKSFQKMLIEYLGQQRIIPAYGFPLDVVSLYTDDGSIERDLRSAIREFAPGNTLIKSMDAYEVKGLMPNFLAINDNTSYNMLYFAQCPNPACQQVIVGDIHPNQCHSCGNPIPNDLVRQAIRPNGFATKPGRDATNYMTRPSLWTKSETILNIEPISFRRNGAETAIQYTSLKFGRDVIYLNKGSHGCGYWLCNCNAMGSEVRFNDQVHANFNAHRGNNGNHTARHNISIACSGKADVWLCRIPAAAMRDIAAGTERIAGSIIATALQVAISKELNIDSRIFDTHYFYSTDGLTICLYEAGASSGYLKTVKANERDYIRQALELIGNCNCERGCPKCILNYSSANTLAKISKDQYSHIKDWINDHIDALFAAEDPVINGFRVCGIDLYDFKREIRNANTINLVLPDLTSDILDDGKNIINCLAAQNNTRVNVFIKDYTPTADASFPEKQEAYKTEQSILSLRTRTENRFTFYRTEANWFEHEGKNRFLQVNNSIYLVDNDIDINTLIVNWPNEKVNDLGKISDDTVRFAWPTNDPVVGETIQVPQARRSFTYDQKGTPFDFSTILNELGDLDNITKIEYSDCYILPPQTWAVLLQILMDLPQVPVTIKTLETDIYKHKRLPVTNSGELREISYQDLLRIKNRDTFDNREICLCKEHDRLTEEIFENELGAEVRIQRYGKNIGNDRLPHYRTLKMTDADNQVISLYFDSGVSAFGFNNQTGAYFDDNREKMIALKPTIIFVEDERQNR